MHNVEQKGSRGRSEPGLGFPPRKHDVMCDCAGCAMFDDPKPINQLGGAVPMRMGDSTSDA